LLRLLFRYCRTQSCMLHIGLQNTSRRADETNQLNSAKNDDYLFFPTFASIIILHLNLCVFQNNYALSRNLINVIVSSFVYLYLAKEISSYYVLFFCLKKYFSLNKNFTILQKRINLPLHLF
jgi:hypothetical protein